LTPTDLFLLECYYFEENKEVLDIFEIPSYQDLQLSISHQYLKKNDYLVEDPNDTSKTMISVKGKNLIHALEITSDAVQVGENVSAQAIVLDLSKTPKQCFEEWWKAYPTTPAWIADDGSTKFVASRNLKDLTKAEAKSKYLKLLNQELKHEDLIGSLRYEIKMKKLDSIKKNANQMEYFKGMRSYFNSERYLQHIEDFRNNPDFVKGEENKVKSRKRNVTDI
jgi:hypothetical protein